MTFCGQMWVKIREKKRASNESAFFSSRLALITLSQSLLQIAFGWMIRNKGNHLSTIKTAVWYCFVEEKSIKKSGIQTISNASNAFVRLNGFKKLGNEQYKGFLNYRYYTLFHVI